jgi:hypothetical protein
MLHVPTKVKWDSFYGRTSVPRLMNEAIWTVIIILLLTQQSLSQSKSAASAAPANQRISFCDLLRHPDQYDGKVVIVTATMVRNFEYSSMFDETCKAQSPGDEVSALVIIQENRIVSKETKYEVLDTPLQQKLNNILRTSQARVTMVALFTAASKPPSDGQEKCVSCMRFKLEGQRLLAVHKLKWNRPKKNSP